MAAELLGANYATTTVASGGYSSGASALNVLSTSTGTGLSSFPAAGNFRVTIFDQSTGAPKVILLVTAIASGTQFTTSAELDGNAVAGDLVICTITTNGMAALFAQLNQTGTFPAPATVPFAGARWKQTDGPYEAISNGTSWQYFWNGYPVTPPPATGWTSEGIATESGATAGTVHYTNGFGYLIGNDLGNESVGVNYVAAPSTPYTITARMMFDSSGIISSALYFSNNGFSGPAVLVGNAFGFRDSSGKYLVMGQVPYTGTPTNFFSIGFFNSDVSFNTNAAAVSNGVTIAGLINNRDLVYQIQNDGTNLSFWLSVDGGQTFVCLHTETITAHLADAASVCWGAHKDQGSATVLLYDWTVGT